MPRVVNDVHSGLNATRVREVIPVASAEALQRAVRRARGRRQVVCLAGARHAMGGQAFARDAILLDLRGLNRVLHLDPERGTVEVEAGADWPQLVAKLLEQQQGRREAWGIAQKQTGADRLTLGGAAAANIHGRGLRMKPFISDLESLRIVDADGELRRASRDENPDLFRLVVGGYGLFGAVASLTLRLAPRRKLERVVTLERIEDLLPAFERRIAEGSLYGDFQFAIDEDSPEFLRRGVFACYRPVDSSTPVPAHQRELSVEDWRELLRLAHARRLSRSSATRDTTSRPRARSTGPTPTSSARTSITTTATWTARRVPALPPPRSSPRSTSPVRFWRTSWKRPGATCATGARS